MGVALENKISLTDERQFSTFSPESILLGNIWDQNIQSPKILAATVNSKKYRVIFFACESAITNKNSEWGKKPIAVAIPLMNPNAGIAFIYPS